MNAPHPAALLAHPAAARMAQIESFYAMEIMREAAALEHAGRSIIYLCVGEPDFVAPAAVMDAADAAARRGDTHYTVALGIAPLREAIPVFTPHVMASRCRPSASPSPQAPQARC